MNRAGKTSVLAVSLWLMAIAAHSQSRPSIDSLPPSGESAAFSDVSSLSRGQQQRDDAALSLPANRILQLVQRRPEIAIELKQLLAERMRDSGLPLQEGGISDEMLFRRIASDPGFRSAATLLLEARGYVASEDIGAVQGSSSPALNSRVDDAVTGDSTQASGIGSSDIQSPMDRMSVSNPSDTSSPSNLSDADLELLRQQERMQSMPLPGRQSAMQSSQPQLRSRSTAAPPTGQEREKAETGPDLLHKPTPYNLLALHDLYTQVPAQQQTIARFGADVFLRRSGTSPTSSSSTSPMAQAATAQASALDLPIGPDYVLGPGDGLTIAIWGGVSQTLSRAVDSSGKITLPEVGPVGVAGMKLGQAQTLLQRVLAPQFRSAHVDVTLVRLRTVRIYVVGDVRLPGAYDLHSLSSPLNALYAAGGPTSVGSLRILRHLRGATVVSEIDLYDFLLHGIRAPAAQLQDGDTILVPPAGPQITVTGSVKRPAIYELKAETKLFEVLEDAGGVQVSAALRHVSVERIAANDHRETLRIGTATDGLPDLRHALETFPVMDGDRVVVAPIVPWSDRAIYIEGHVIRPGRLAYHDGMVLSEVIRSYQDLLPEPSEHGEIIRLMPPDMRPETIEFDLHAALGGGLAVTLRPLDTIRISGRYESDAPKVTIRGEVLRPGIYSLSDGMSAGQLVKMAGGFTRSALLAEADLASYEVQAGKAVVSRRSTIAVGEAVRSAGSAGDPALKPGDVLTVHQVSGWNDIGASIRINGEVSYPGTYGLQEGEKLSSVLHRCGGFRQTAYPTGAILLRLQVRDLEEKSRSELIHQLETTSVAAKLGSTTSGQEQASELQLLTQQQDQVLQRLRSQHATGRLVIRIDSDISKWENTSADIELRSGDVLVIPKRPGFVLVSGQVYNASGLTYVPHQTAGWYLQHAGGTTDMANRKEVFIVRANGDVIGRRSGGWHEDVLSTRLDAGDVIVVPQKIIGGTMFWRNMMTTAQLFSSIAIPLAIAGI